MPDVGLWRDDRHNYFGAYEDLTFGPVPGATGPLGVLDKPAIIGWAKNETAACAVRNYAFLGELIAKGGEE